MRVKMLDWWKNRRHEDLPKDTIPPQPSAPDEPTPKRTLEPDTIRNFPPPGKTPDSVTPVGVSTVPMKSLRGIAVAVALVAAALLLLVVIRRGERPRVTEPASAASVPIPALTSEPPRAPTPMVATPPAASSAPRAPTPAVEHELPVRPNPVSAASESMPPRAVAPSVAPQAAPRTKTRAATAEPRNPTQPAEPPANQNSIQDPFAKPFFPPAK
jgi:hypothetical protein